MSKPWSEADDKRLLAMLEADALRLEICRQLDRSLSAINARIKELKLPPKVDKDKVKRRRVRVKELHAEGKTNLQIVQALAGDYFGHYVQGDLRALNLKPNRSKIDRSEQQFNMPYAPHRKRNRPRGRGVVKRSSS